MKIMCMQVRYKKKIFKQIFFSLKVTEESSRIQSLSRIRIR